MSLEEDIQKGNSSSTKWKYTGLRMGREGGFEVEGVVSHCFQIHNSHKVTALSYNKKYLRNQEPGERDADPLE